MALDFAQNLFIITPTTTSFIQGCILSSIMPLHGLLLSVWIPLQWHRAIASSAAGTDRRRTERHQEEEPVHGLRLWTAARLASPATALGENPTAVQTDPDATPAIRRRLLRSTGLVSIGDAARVRKNCKLLWLSKASISAALAEAEVICAKSGRRLCSF